MARLGLIYTDVNWVVKTFFHRSEFLIEPYLYIAGVTTTTPSIKPEITYNITQEVQYKKEQSSIRAVANYSILSDSRVDRSAGFVENDTDKQTIFSTYLEYKLALDIYNSVNTYIAYTDNRNFDKVNSFKEYKAMVRILNRLGKVNIFNELIYNRDSLSSENYLDYSLGLMYRYSKSLNISIKGENILDKARENVYSRGKSTNNGWESLESLLTPTIDRKVYVSMKYLF